MNGENNINIVPVRGEENQFIIKDNIGITIGRIYIVEFLKEEQYCLSRIKFYREDKSSYPLLKDALEKLLKILFNNMEMYKVSVIADENINLEAFLNIGFEFEGILWNSTHKPNTRGNEIIFGLDANSYSRNSINKGLHIKGDNIELNLLTPDKGEDLLDYYIRNKEHLKTFEPKREEDFYTINYQKQNLLESYKQYLNGSSVNLGIYKANRFIGKIQISNIVMGVFKNAFIGYSIDKDEQNKGYMKEALNLALNYAFNEINIHRIEASTLVTNIKSQRVLKACGFKELGLNEKYLFLNGKWRDHITFYKIAMF